MLRTLYFRLCDIAARNLHTGGLSKANISTAELMSDDVADAENRNHYKITGYITDSTPASS